METLLRDIRLALRALARKPGVAVMAIASLGLAIGFSTAAFSVLDAYSLRDLPVNQPKQLFFLAATTREQRSEPLSWPEYEALSARTHSLSGIVTENRRGPRVKLPDRDQFPITAGVSDNYFDVLGVKPARGETFHAGKGLDGVMVISDRFWRQSLAGDPGVVGRTLPVGRGVLQIVAVLPPEFHGINRGIAVDLFVPMQGFFGSMNMARANSLRFADYDALARLRPGAAPEQAQKEADAVLGQLEKDGLSAGPDRKAGLAPFAAKGLRAKVEANAAFLGLMILLILIAAANLANLRLVDNESRRRETGIRLALGAGRGDLARQHLAETLLLGGMGTALGLLVAAWLIQAAPALFYAGQSYLDYSIRLDLRTFAFSSIALATVALAGTLIPWSDAWRRRISPALQGARTTGSSRWLSGLVIAEMALVTAVTCSAGLLWRSLDKIAAVRPAMNPDAQVLLVSGAAGAPVESLANRLAGLPGVERVAWARRAMLSGSLGGSVVGVEIPGQPKMEFHFNQVSPSYFDAVGARVMSGRAFQEADGPDAMPVAMVNATFVRRFYSDGQAVGAWIRVNGKLRHIVGVMEDGPSLALREEPEPYLYFPYAQMRDAELTLFIATRKDPAQFADTVRSFIRGTDKEFLILSIQTLRTHLRRARSSEQLAAELIGALAAVGLLLAAAGLFGVTLYAVAKRTPELGVRVAMGATPGALARQVLKEAAVRIAMALPLGWALSYLGRNAIQKLLFGVAADDPWTFAGASVVVAAIGCAAALHPALRAARVDPMTALRSE